MFVTIYILSVLEAAKNKEPNDEGVQSICREKLLCATKSGILPLTHKSALVFGHTLKLESCRSCKNVREAEDVTFLLRLKHHILKTILNITYNICFSTCFSSLVTNIDKQPWNWVNIAISVCINISQFKCFDEHASGITVKYATKLDKLEKLRRRIVKKM